MLSDIIMSVIFKFLLAIDESYEHIYYQVYRGCYK